MYKLPSNESKQATSELQAPHTRQQICIAASTD